MKFIADEGVDAPIVRRLRSSGHDISYIAEISPSITDELVLKVAVKENRILLTIDKDFGELVFRMHKAHSGVILIRLEGKPASEKADIVEMALKMHSNELEKSYTVIQKGSVRIRKF